MDPATSPTVTRASVVHDPAVPPRAVVATEVVAVGAPPDLQQLRWGPIWAGLLTAVGVFFLLSLGAIAVGLQAAPGAAEQDDLGIIAVVVTSAIALVSFFLGGWVSSWSAGLTDPGRSALNGFLVWASWLVVVLLLAAIGLGTLVGAMGQLFGDVNLGATDVEPQQLVNTLRDSAWQTLLALGLTAAAAMLGGVVGARDDLRWGRTL